MGTWLKTLVFFIICVAFYGIHRYWIPYGAFNDNPAYLDFSYLYHAVFTISVILLLWIISYWDSDFLGFLNMVSGVLKIILFVYLAHRLQFSLERKDFLTIFTPYALGQSLEIFWINQYLKAKQMADNQ